MARTGAVGPGGGFEALVSRFGGAVHVLSANVRQVDPAERTALGHLRSGDVDAAVSWYGASGRITVFRDRDSALDATVAAWASDVAGGSDTAMYAWRRANVAELNRGGRRAWDGLGKLSGPDRDPGTEAGIGAGGAGKAEGSSFLQGTAVGDAAVAWTTAVNEWRWCEKRAPHVGLRERLQLHRRADRAAERIGPLRDAFEALAAPERPRLRAELPQSRKTLDELYGQYAGHVHFTVAHPEALRRLERLDSLVGNAAWDMDLERQDIDRIAPHRPERPEQWLERVAPTIDRGIDLGIGL